MGLFTIGCWLVGFTLLLSNNTANVHSTFRKMWGARLISLSFLIFAVTFLKSGSYILVVCDIILFIMYAVDEHKYRMIFNIQFAEFRNKLK